jgi:hypothetical protein
MSSIVEKIPCPSKKNKKKTPPRQTPPKIYKIETRKEESF